MTDPLFNDVTNEDVEQALSLLNQMEGTERYEMNTVGFLSMFKRITNQMIVIDGLLKENDALKAENKRLKHEVKELKTHRDVVLAILDGYEIEIKNKNGEGWTTPECKSIWLSQIDSYTDRYRIKPTKPRIDWNHVSDKLNFLARDEDGSAYLYGNKPNRNNSLWCSVDQDVICASAFKSLEIGTCDWKDSLIERPKDNRL